MTERSYRDSGGGRWGWIQADRDTGNFLVCFCIHDYTVHCHTRSDL